MNSEQFERRVLLACIFLMLVLAAGVAIERVMRIFSQL